MIFVFILILLAVAAAAAFYYNKLLMRFLSLFTSKPKKITKIIVRLFSAALGIMTGYFLSTVGIVLLHFIVIALLFELVYIIISKLLRSEEPPLWTKIRKSAVLPVITSAAVLVFGYINMYNPVRTEYTVSSDKALSQNYKTVVLSDMHYGDVYEKEKLDSLIPLINAENADFIILDGDIADEETTSEELLYLFSSLGQLSSKYGVYYIEGNHDLQNYSRSPYYTREEFKETIESSGVIYLDDKSVLINNDINLIGRKDRSSERASIDTLTRSITNDKFTVTADHQPVEYSQNIKEGVDLIVSGHTHAGQIFPAGYIIKLMPSADLWYGHETFDDMDAVVSSGIAGWGFPIRTQKNSEYVVINIVSA